MKYSSIFYLFIFFVVSSFFIIACSDVETPTGQAIKEPKEPIKEVETKPVQSEQIQEPKEEKPSCSDECSADSCDGFSYVSCLSGKDGCKYTQNKGVVKEKCGVECVQDSDCGSNQNCESNKCKTEEKQEALIEEVKTKETETSSALDSLNKLMEEAENKLEETMNKCNAPFKCSSNCAQYLDVGQKDCPSGQVCCMTEQSEVDQLVDDLVGQSPETQSGETSKQEALNICYKRAKECSDDILGIELELKSACMEIYMWTSGTSEILDFADGLC